MAKLQCNKVHEIIRILGDGKSQRIQYICIHDQNHPGRHEFQGCTCPKCEKTK